MEQPHRGHDPEKGLDPIDEPEETLGEGISNAFSKAGEGLTSAFSKAGEGILGAGKRVGEGVLGAGSAIKDAGKKVGEGVGLVVDTKKNYPKKNPRRAKQERKFHKGYKAVAREEPKDTNLVGNITKLLPANTFLMFQTLAPLSTNDGNCHTPEIFMTSVMLLVLASTCILVCFTDTVQFNGKVYHGIVTWSGLWNPSFKGDPAFIDLRQHEMKLAQFYADRKRYKVLKREARIKGLEPPPRPEEPVRPVGPQVMGSIYSSGNSQYHLKFTDFLHAGLSAMAFCTLTMLTDPVSSCFYPNIPGTVVKTLPLLVGFIISAIFAFSPPARNGIAHPLPPKVPSITDNYRPPDPKGIVHGPQLPPKPTGKDGYGAKHHGGHDDDDDNDGSFSGSAKRLFGKLFGDSNGDQPGANERHWGMDTVNSLAHGFLDKYGDDLKEGAAQVTHSLGDSMKKEASQLLSNAGSQHGKDQLHIPLAQIQEAAKSVHAETLLAGLVNATGAGHPALAAAAHSAYTQGAKDAMLQIHKDIQTAVSGPLAGLSKQSSMALSRANSMLNSAGPSLSLPSPHDAHDALFHEAAQILQRSGLASAAPQGSEAASIALAAGQALMQAGLFPGGPSPQAQALSAYAPGMANLNASAANALVQDAGSLAQQGVKSFTDVQGELARQQSALTHGLKAQLQTLYSPGASVAQGFTNLVQNGQVALQQAALAQGTFASNFTSAAAREAGTLLQEGADQGVAGIQAELLKQGASVVQKLDTQVQSITQPAASLAQDAAAFALQGSQALSNVKSDLIKQKDAISQEVTTQARAISTPAASVALDVATLSTPGSQLLSSQLRDAAASQKLLDGVNSQFAERLALGMARGMSMKMHGMAPAQQQHYMPEPHQIPASTALDVASLIQQGSRQLQHPQSLDPAQIQVPSMLQRQASGHFNYPLQTAQQVVESHLRRLASIPPPQLNPSILPAAASVTINTVVDSRPAESSRRVRDATGTAIEDVTDAARTLACQAPASSVIVASTSDALANATARIWRDRPESTEITDAISVEEITSESETEGRPSEAQIRTLYHGPSSSQAGQVEKQT